MVGIAHPKVAPVVGFKLVNIVLVFLKSSLAQVGVDVFIDL
jgi:hypothetical protein